jgi:hypothetical protein
VIGEDHDDRVPQRSAIAQYAHKVSELTVQPSSGASVLIRDGGYFSPIETRLRRSPGVRPMDEREMNGEEGRLVELEPVVEPLD